jgi:hypothetical protein
MVSGPPETLVLTERALLEESPKGPGVQAKPEAIKSARAQVEPSPVDGEMVTNAGTGAPLRLAGDTAANRAEAQISDVRAISAETANAPFAKRGWFDPYASGTRPRVFKTQSELDFVRLHGANNPEGRFMVRADEIAGMTPNQIRQHLALEFTPTYISDVRVPASTQMQAGRVGAQPQWGVPNKGGMQYQLLQDIPSSSFTNTRPLW